jgi:hypothetical protein
MVFVQGIYKGRTPIKVEGLPPRATPIRVEAPGYVPREWSEVLDTGIRDLREIVLFHDQNAPIDSSEATSPPRPALWPAGGSFPADFEATSGFHVNHGYVELHASGAGFRSLRWLKRMRYETTCTIAIDGPRRDRFGWRELEQMFLSRAAVSTAPDQHLYVRGVAPAVESSLTAHGYAAGWEEIDRLHLANQIRERLLKVAGSEFDAPNAIDDAFANNQGAFSRCIEQYDAMITLDLVVERQSGRARIARLAGSTQAHLVRAPEPIRLRPSEVACVHKTVNAIECPRPPSCDVEVHFHVYGREPSWPPGVVE